MGAPSRSYAKLFHCWLGDPEIEALSLEDQARWVRLFLYISSHGTAGAVTLDMQASRSLARALRTPATRGQSQPLRDLLERLPGVSVVTGEGLSQSITISFKNWHKYQVDSSADRTRRWRQRRPTRDGTSRVTGDGHHASRVTVQENSREDKNPLTPVHVSTSDTLRALQSEIGNAHPDWSARKVEDAAFERLEQPHPDTFRGQSSP